MAGTYGDASQRIHWHRDGSQSFVLYGSGPSIKDEHTQAEMDKLCDGTTSYNSYTNTGPYPTLCVVFARKIDLTAYTFHGDGDAVASGLNVWTSVDTTTALDGTWVDQGAASNNGHPYRDVENALSVSGIQAIKFRAATTSSFGDPWYYQLHIYGTYASGEDTDRLEFWDATLDQQADGAALDFGDVARSGTTTKQVRVKNMSASFTAEGVVVAEDSGDTTIEFSSDDITYASSLNLGDITSGSISSAFYVRKTAGAAEALSADQGLVTATATSWA